MESLARIVAIIVAFPLLLSPAIYFLNRIFLKKWLIYISIPLTIVNAIFGLGLLLSDIGTIARAFGLSGLFFSIATWRIFWRARGNPDHTLRKDTKS